MKRVLVTGGAGYIGSTAVSMLIEAGYAVSVLDDCSTGHQDSVDARANFFLGSILDSAKVKEALHEVDMVMHFAAKSLVGESMQKPELYHHNNVDGSHVLFDAMIDMGISHIVFSSSAATYGEPQNNPVLESDYAKPTNPYGESKLGIDRILAELSSSANFAAISLRYFNVAGAFKSASGWLAERHDPETHLIPNVLKATARNPLRIFGTDWPTADGTCIRDYVHVIDLIDAHIRAFDALVPGKHEIINLGSGGGYSVQQVVDTASKVIDARVPVIQADRRAGDPAVLVASIEKAERILGWKPVRNLETMIRDTAESITA